MNRERQALAWGVILVVFIAFIAIFRGILLPFVVGLGIAYFLDPLADRLERQGASRFVATLVIVSLTALVATAIFILVMPLLVNQIRELAGTLPEHLQTLRDALLHAARQWLGDDFPELQAALKSEFGELAKSGATLLGSVIKSVWSGGLALVNFLSLLLVTPVVTFYMLLDWDHMVARVDGWLPREHAATIRRLAGEVNDVLAGFIRGQGTVAVLLGLFYATGLTWLGLKYGLLIGLVAGLLSFVPFVGTLTGFVISTAFAIAQFWPDWLSIFKIVAVFIIGQVIEGNLLSPKIVGDRIKLHPVWLIFSLFAFSYLFGIVGLLIAVPVAAAIGVLARFAIGEYRQSSLYYGPGGAEPGQDGEDDVEHQGEQASETGVAS